MSIDNERIVVRPVPGYTGMISLSLHGFLRFFTHDQARALRDAITAALGEDAAIAPLEE